MPDKLQFRDRREMQLFAEQVLQYRFPDKSFQSFGYHQPNIDQHRQVYTVTDNTIYYFLPAADAAHITTAIVDLAQLLKNNPLMDFDGSAKAIKTAVLVGEFSPPDRASLDDAEITANDQAIADYTGPLDLGLSYIDEDLYWDIRRDRIDTTSGLRTPVTEILTTMKSVPPVAPITDRPRYLNRPIADSPVPTMPAHLALPEPVDQLTPVDQPLAVPIADRADQHESAKGSLGWLDGINSLALLAGVTLLGLLGSWFLWRWIQLGLPLPANQQAVTPLAPANQNGNLPVPAPPPNNTNRQQTFTTKPAPPKPATTAPAATAPRPAVAANRLQVRSPSAGYNAVNLREGPGYGYRAIGAIRQGNYVVDAGQQVGNWRRVSYYNKTGWVYQSFIR
jgi:Bacterial SH3 domain